METHTKKLPVNSFCADIKTRGGLNLLLSQNLYKLCPIPYSATLLCKWLILDASTLQ